VTFESATALQLIKDLLDFAPGGVIAVFLGLAKLLLILIRLNRETILHLICLTINLWFEDARGPLDQQLGLTAAGVAASVKVHSAADSLQIDCVSHELLRCLLDGSH
jgi:hypothetical protein